MKILNILSSPFRAVWEEQDDTVVWLSHTLRRAGADLDLLLRASAASYVLRDVAAAPLTIGQCTQRHAPYVQGQVQTLAQDGAGVFVLQEDLERYRLTQCPRLPEVQVMTARELPRLLTNYDLVWHW